MKPPPGTSRGVINGVSEEIDLPTLHELLAPNEPYLVHARFMGQTRSVLLTFDGYRVPYYVKLGYTCRRPLPSTAKRTWLCVLGLLGVIYLPFGIPNCDPAIPQTRQQIPRNTSKSSIHFIRKKHTGRPSSLLPDAHTNYGHSPQQASKRKPYDATTNSTTRSQNSSSTWKPWKELSKGYDRVPFPLENCSVLPTARKVLSECRKNLDYLFFVHTASTHSSHRRILRESVGNASLEARYNWSIVFFVGLSNVEKVSQGVFTEAQAHGDIVVLPFLDTYRNLTYKFVYGIKWTVENCPEVRFILKMDDDIVIHIPTIMKKFGRIPESRVAAGGPKIHCCVWDKMPVLRQTALPWYLSEKMYPKNVFPRYCSGSAVFIDASALPALYNATFSVPYIPVDDAYVTGELAAAAGITHEPLNNVYSFDTYRWTSVGNGSLLVVQLSNADLRAKAWKIVLNALSENSASTTTTASPKTQAASPSSEPLSRLTSPTSALTQRTVPIVRAVNVSVTVSSTQITHMKEGNTSKKTL
ncbi:uncharacterized protein LOC144139678 [Haemaphysalis longicornis]